jgi:hypothetical protein
MIYFSLMKTPGGMRQHIIMQQQFLKQQMVDIIG